MENCYVLFVKSGYEEKIAAMLKLILDSSVFLPFVPIKEILFRKKGDMLKEQKYAFQDICL